MVHAVATLPSVEKRSQEYCVLTGYIYSLLSIHDQTFVAELAGRVFAVEPLSLFGCEISQPAKTVAIPIDVIPKIARFMCLPPSRYVHTTVREAAVFRDDCARCDCRMESQP